MGTAAVQGGLNAGGSGSASFTFPSNVTAGNLLIACCQGGSSTTNFTISDTRSNTWVAVDNVVIISGAICARIFYVASAAAGSTKVTISCTGNAGDTPLLQCIEVSGASGSVDGTNHGTASNSSGSTAPATSAFTPTAGAFLVGCFVDNTGMNPETITPNTGWSDSISAGTHNLTETNGSSFYGSGAQYLANAPASSEQSKWTLGDTVEWVTAYASFAPSAGATDPFPAGYYVEPRRAMLTLITQ